jgi:hypothetical protein
MRHRFPDDGAGVGSDRQVGMRAAEDDDLIGGRRLAVGHLPEAPPDPERVQNDDAVALGKNALDTGSRAVRLAGASHSDKTEAVVEGGVGNRMFHVIIPLVAKWVFEKPIYQI